MKDLVQLLKSAIDADTGKRVVWVWLGDSAGGHQDVEVEFGEAIQRKLEVSI